MTGILTLFSSRWYWLVLALGGIGLLAVALYYQYALGEEPCQACIQARIWVMAFTLLALVMLSLARILSISSIGFPFN